KQAVLATGVKANHLTYLGDCEIGAETNVGAGTITCNYDGFRKHRTVIGARVQIGSDTQLVAPVAVGDDAYVGAGTTVTHDVPSGALAVRPAPKRHLEGWTGRGRAGENGASEAVEVRPAVRAKPRTGKRRTRARARTARARRRR